MRTAYQLPHSVSASKASRASGDFVAFFHCTCENTAYTMKFFEVELLGARVMLQVETVPKTRLLAQIDICRLEAFDEVSVTVPMLLPEAGLLCRESWSDSL